MAIIIRNLGGDPLGVCDYEVRINEKQITTFKHDRAKGLTQCLREAMAAVDRHHWQEEAGKWSRLAETLKP